MTEQERIDKLYLDGDMPLFFWLDMNGRSLDWNIYYQDYLNGKRAEKAIKKFNLNQKKKQLKSEIEKQICNAIELALTQETDNIANNVADKVIADIDNELHGVSNGIPAQRTFSSDLGNLVGRILGDAPFKLLDSFIDEVCASDLNTPQTLRFAPRINF